MELSCSLREDTSSTSTSMEATGKSMEEVPSGWASPWKAQASPQHQADTVKSEDDETEEEEPSPKDTRRVSFNEEDPIVRQSIGSTSVLTPAASRPDKAVAAGSLCQVLRHAAELLLTSLASVAWLLTCILDQAGMLGRHSTAPLAEKLLSQGLALAGLSLACLTLLLQRSLCCEGCSCSKPQFDLAHNVVTEAWVAPESSTSLGDSPVPSPVDLSRRARHRRCRVVAAVVTQWFLLCGALAWLVIHAANRRIPQIIAGLLAVLAVLVKATLSMLTLLRYCQLRSTRVEDDGSHATQGKSVELQPWQPTQACLAVAKELGIDPSTCRSSQGRWKPLLASAFLDRVEGDFAGAREVREARETRARTFIFEDARNLHPTLMSMLQNPQRVRHSSKQRQVSGDSDASGSLDAEKVRGSSKASNRSRRSAASSHASGFSDVSDTLEPEKVRGSSKHSNKSRRSCSSSNKISSPVAFRRQSTASWGSGFSEETN